MLGKYPATGEDVLLLNGRYGWYVQVGPTPEDKKAPKPRRASLPKGVPPESVTLEDALKWLSLPREVGHHPKTGLPIVANIGRFGPYLLHDGKFKSIPKEDDVYTIDLARALEVLEMPATRGRSSAGEKKELGKHPDDAKPVFLQNGRYGWYVSHNKVNATLPRDLDPQAVTLEDALPLLAAKAEKGGTTKKAAVKKRPPGAKPPSPDGLPRHRQPQRKRGPQPPSCARLPSLTAAAPVPPYGSWRGLPRWRCRRSAATRRNPWQ